MNRKLISREPMADYLEPQFGNIYHYNFTVVGQFDVQKWTDELEQAVRDYMLDKASKGFVDQVVDRLVPPAYEIESRKQQVASIIAHHQPWEIAHVFHEAAVRATPTLHALIGHMDHWLYEDDRIDASMWLDEHATNDQLHEMVEAGDNIQSVIQEGFYIDPANALVRALDPPALLAAWSDVVRPAPSDLTDAELALVIPLLPKSPGCSSHPASWLLTARSSLNGIFYRFTNDVLWSHVPRRYGKSQALCLRWFRYKNGGFFRRMYLALQDEPEAKRIVEWLREVDPDATL